jgi:hypothetical protein
VDEFIGIVRGRTAHSSRNPAVAEREGQAAGGKAAGGKTAGGKTAGTRKSTPARPPAAKKRPGRRR